MAKKKRAVVEPSAALGGKMVRRRAKEPAKPVERPKAERASSRGNFSASTMQDLHEYAIVGAAAKRAPSSLPVKELPEGVADMVAAVFADRNRHCALRVAVHPDGWTDYVSIEQGIIDVQQALTREFHAVYTDRFADYPLSEAIKHFTNPRTPGIIVSDAARRVLNNLNLTAEVKHPKTSTKEEKAMANDDNTGNSETKTRKKRGGASPNQKKFADQASKSKDEKAAKKKAAKKNDGEGAGRGRTSPFAGKKIKVLSKELGARPGSLREAIRKKVIGSKNVDDVLGQTVEADGKEAVITGIVITNMVAAGIISVA